MSKLFAVLTIFVSSHVFAGTCNIIIKNEILGKSWEESTTSHEVETLKQCRDLAQNQVNARFTDAGGINKNFSYKAEYEYSTKGSVYGVDLVSPEARRLQREEK